MCPNCEQAEARCAKLEKVLLNLMGWIKHTIPEWGREVERAMQMAEAALDADQGEKEGKDR